VAAPVAAAILEKTLTYLGAPAEGTPEAAAATASRRVQPYSEDEDENSW